MKIQRSDQSYDVAVCGGGFAMSKEMLSDVCWYKFLTKKDITGNAFDDFDVPVTEQEREIVIRAVNADLS